MFAETSCVNIFPNSDLGPCPQAGGCGPGEPRGDSIVFQDPKSRNNIVVPRALQPNEHNSRNATFPVRAGALILFPAWLPHSVEGHRSEQERISISFNIMFRQFGEEMAQPKWEYRPGSQPTTAS